MSPPNDDHLIPQQAARPLHMSPRTVLRWQREGRIPTAIADGDRPVVGLERFIQIPERRENGAG